MPDRAAKMEFRAKIGEHTVGEVTFVVIDPRSAQVVENIMGNLHVDDDVVVSVEYVRRSR